MNISKTIRATICSLAAICIGTAAQGEEWVGKTVLIKTGRDANTVVCIENYLPVIAPIPRSRDACTFRVAKGSQPGTVTFEWVKEPGLFLQHGDFRLLLKGINENALFRIVRPLRGNEGISLQAFNFPTHHLTIAEGGQLAVQKDIAQPRKGIFFLQEQLK